MINIKDKKGRPIGLEHDYEYRGMNRERNRNAPWYRAIALWLIFAALFTLGGLVSLVKYFNGTTDSTFGEVLFITLICLGIALFCLWFIRIGYRKHQQLLRAIGQEGRR